MDNNAFRSAFPEFSDSDRYPDSMLNFWASFGEKMLNKSRWAELYDNGLFLFVAHQSTIAANEREASALGSSGGTASSVISSQSVGDVSVVYDTNNALETKAGHWNLTIYGRQYIRLARLFGMGGRQL